MKRLLTGLMALGMVLSAPLAEAQFIRLEESDASPTIYPVKRIKLTNTDFTLTDNSDGVGTVTIPSTFTRDTEWDTIAEIETATGVNIVVSTEVAGFEATLEGVMDLQDMQGAVTDAQVPDNITVTLAATATALAANGTNASAGNAILGVDASGNAEGAFDVATQTELDTHESDVTSVHGLSIVNTPAAGDLLVRNAGNTAFEDVPLSGDGSISSAGALTVNDDSHTHSATTLVTDSVSADELNATGVEAELEAELDLQDLQGAVTDAQVPDTITITDLTCTDCIGPTEITDSYVLNTGDAIAGDLDFNDGSGDTPKATFTPATGAAFSIYVEDTGDDLQIEVNSASAETVDFVNTNSSMNVTIDGTLSVASDSGGTLSFSGNSIQTSICDMSNGGATLFDCAVTSQAVSTERASGTFARTNSGDGWAVGVRGTANKSGAGASRSSQAGLEGVVNLTGTSGTDTWAYGVRGLGTVNGSGYTLSNWAGVYGSEMTVTAGTLSNNYAGAFDGMTVFKSDNGDGLWFTSALGTTPDTNLYRSAADTLKTDDAFVATGGFTGALTGNASTATALAANGGNCSAGSGALGVDASGAAESCTDFEEDLANSAGLMAALSDETGSATGTPLAVFNQSPSIAAPTLTGTTIIGATTGGTITAAAGVFTLAGVGNTNNESLTFNLEGSTTTAVIGSGTGLTRVELSGLDFEITQTTPSLFLTDSTGSADDYSINADADAFNITNATDGNVLFAEDSSHNLTLGSATAPAITLTTDGTGNAEVVLPADSVGATELDDTGAYTMASLNTGQGAYELYAMDQDVTTTSTVTFDTITLTNNLAIGDGGTGAGSEQAAINALTQVSAATNEYVLTKDTGSGNAIWKPVTSSQWTESAGFLYNTTVANDMGFGTTAAISGAKFSFDGDEDEIQALIQGNATQTSDIFVIEKSDGTDLFRVTNAAGIVFSSGSGTQDVKIGDASTATATLSSNLSGSNDPTLTLLDSAWKWAAASEDITCTFTSNTLTCASSTGVTSLAYGSILVTGNQSSSTTAAGLTEAAIASEVDTGTDAARAVTPDALAGSNLGEKVVELVVFDFTTATATGDGKFYFTVPSSMDGMNLVEVHAQVITAGTTNTTNVDLARCATVASGNVCSGTVADMLSTNITIDTGEDDSGTAAAAAVIDATNDDVATNQVIRVDVDAVHTTPAQGLIITLVFRLP